VVNNLRFNRIDTIEPSLITDLFLGNINTQRFHIGTDNSVQTVNIGTGSGTTTINIGGPGDTVNISGTLQNINSTNINVTDKNITLNRNGPTGSSFGAGLDFEEAGLIPGFIRVSGTREDFQLKAPGNSQHTLSTGVLSKNETVAYQSQITNLQTNIDFVDTRVNENNDSIVALQQKTAPITNSTGKIGIGTTSPSQALDVVGSINFSGNLFKNGVLLQNPEIRFIQVFDSANNNGTGRLISNNFEVFGTKQKMDVTLSAYSNASFVSANGVVRIMTAATSIETEVLVYSATVRFFFNQAGVHTSMATTKAFSIGPAYENIPLYATFDWDSPNVIMDDQDWLNVVITDVKE
jgi:hypothetical protein